MLSAEAIYYYFLIVTTLFLLFNTFTFWNKGAYLGGIGPGWWPMILLIFILLFSIALARNVLKKKVTENKFRLLVYSQYRQIIYLCISISIYTVLLGIVGFIFSTPLIFFATLKILNSSMNIYGKIFFCLLITVFFVFVFGSLIGIPLPRGNIDYFRSMSRIFY